jgi:hypothetical protein
MGDEDQIFSSWGSLMGETPEPESGQQNEANNTYSNQRDVKESCNLM